MDKLQWFKFRPSDWMMGKISKMPHKTQAEFIRFCCQYWNKECKMNIDDAKIEFGDVSWKKLLQYKIIIIDDENVHVKFLDEQMEGINEMRGKRSIAGKISAKKRAKDNKRSTSVQQNSREKSRVEKKENIYRSFSHLSITHDEYKKLCEIWSRGHVENCIDSIENYKKNTNYKSLYLTCRSWLKDTPKKQDEKGDMESFVSKKLETLKKINK